MPWGPAEGGGNLLLDIFWQGALRRMNSIEGVIAESYRREAVFYVMHGLRAKARDSMSVSRSFKEMERSVDGTEVTVG